MKQSSQQQGSAQREDPHVVRVVLDAMGGDNAPAEQVKGAVDAVMARKDIRVFLAGQQEVINAELAKYT